MRRTFAKIALASALTALLASASTAAETGAEATLALSGEYNDNVFASAVDEQEDFITRVLPGLSAFYKGPRLSAEAAYTFDFRSFANGTHDDSETHKLKADALAEVVRNRVFIKLSDTYDKVSIDPARERGKESIFLGQTDSNVFTAEPYVVFRPGRSELTAGYRYVNAWYKEAGTADKRDHVFFLRAGHEISKTTSLNLSADHTEERGAASDFKRDSASAGFRHEYAPESFLSATAGNSWIDFDDGRSYSSVFWNAALSHDFDFLRFSLSSAARMNENPQSTPQWEYTYTAAASRSWARLAAKMNAYLTDYEDSVTEALVTRKYGSTLTLNYEITPALAYALEATLERFEERSLDAHTRRAFLNQSLSYRLSEGLFATLTYNYLRYRSADLPQENYETNRVIAEVRGTF